MRNFPKGMLCTPSYWEHLTRNRILRWLVHLLKALRGNINLTSVDLSYNLDVTRKEIFYICTYVCVCVHMKIVFHICECFIVEMSPNILSSFFQSKNLTA